MGSNVSEVSRNSHVSPNHDGPVTLMNTIVWRKLIEQHFCEVSNNMSLYSMSLSACQCLDLPIRPLRLGSYSNDQGSRPTESGSRGAVK